MTHYLLIAVVLLFSSCTEKRTFSIPNLNQAKLKLCFLGDTGQDSPEKQRQVAIQLQKENCHRIYHLGDIIYSRGLKDENDPQLKKKFLSFYEELSNTGYKPQISVILGNHDYQGNVEAWKKISKKYPFVFFPETYFAENFQDYCVIALDSNLWLHTGDVFQGLKEVAWLSDINEQNKKCSFIIGLTHHPYAAQGKHRKDQHSIMKTIMEKFILGKVNVLFSGHDHLVADMGDYQGTKQIISGSGGGSSEPGYSPGFAVLELDRSDLKKMPKIKYRLIELRLDV